MSGGAQQLLLIDKRADGRAVRRRVLTVRFVPLVRDAAHR
jgi:protein-L-isoaspartate O-methyltransferase